MKNIDFMGIALKVLGWALIITLPIRPALIAVSVLVFADLVSGLWASLKEKKKITSTGLRRTVNKMLGYESAIIVAFILETYLLDGLPVVKVITGLVGVTEGKSLFENLTRITGINFWDALISKLNIEDLKNPKDDK